MDGKDEEIEQLDFTTLEVGPSSSRQIDLGKMLITAVT